MKPNEIEELRQTLGSVATRAMAVGAQSVGALTRENQTRGIGELRVTFARDRLNDCAATSTIVR
jgi:hypothetical protein